MNRRMIARSGSDGWGMLCRASIAALLLLAPLMCIVFCHVVDAVHRPAPTIDLGCVSFTSQQPSVPAEDSHAPLADLEQLIRAVTECAPSLTSWLVALSVLASLMPVQVALPARIERQPPKPPPRLAA